MRKNSVFWDFCATFSKNCEKTVFFTFFETLCTNFAKNAKKTAFFELFARRLAKSVRKHCFHVFRDTLYKVREKCGKVAVFELFARHSAKIVRKQCFFTFFETLCTKFAKNAKKRRFLRFLRDVPQKVWGNSVFSRYLRHLNLLKVSQKLRKTAFFKLFARHSLKSVRKQCFPRFSRRFAQNSQKMRKKQRFLCFLRYI